MRFTTADPRTHSILHRASNAPSVAGMNVARDLTKTAWVVSSANLDGLRTYQIVQGDSNGENGVAVPGATTTSYRKAHRIAQTRVGIAPEHRAWLSSYQGWGH